MCPGIREHTSRLLRVLGVLFITDAARKGQAAQTKLSRGKVFIPKSEMRQYLQYELTDFTER